MSDKFNDALSRTAGQSEGDERDDVHIAFSPEGPEERTRPGRKPRHESKPRYDARANGDKPQEGRPKLHRKEGGAAAAPGDKPRGKFGKGKGGPKKPFKGGKFKDRKGGNA